MRTSSRPGRGLLVATTLAALALGSPAGAQASDATVLAYELEPMNPGILSLWSSYAYAGSFDDQGNAYFVGKNSATSSDYVILRAGDDGLTKLVKASFVIHGGDPTPIGGQFSSFPFGEGNDRTPDVNATGDVLFRASVLGGSSVSGRFVRHASGEIVKVVAIGDPTPLGGTFQDLRNAALGENGDVVFVGAQNFSSTQAGVFRWRNGLITPLMSQGQAAPAGGTCNMFLTANVVPSIDPSGRVAFFIGVDGGPQEIVVVGAQGPEAWIVYGEPTPFGGTWWPQSNGWVFNDRGELAVLTLINDGPIACVVGHPGAWRMAASSEMTTSEGYDLAGFYTIGEPWRSLNDAGDLLLVAKIMMPGGNLRDVLLLARADGQLQVIGAPGDAAPGGGAFLSSEFEPFGRMPSINDAGQALFAAKTSGLQRELARIDDLVPPSSAWIDLGHALPGAAGAPVLSGDGPLHAGGSVTLHLADAAPSAPALLFLGFAEADLAFKQGVLVPAPGVAPVQLFTSPLGALTLGPVTMPANLPPGVALYLQVWIQDAGAPAGAAASNGLVDHSF